MKIGFVTCVQLGLECLEEIVGFGGELEVLLTLKDHIDEGKSGRIQLDSFADEHGIPLVKVDHVSDEMASAAIVEHDLDWLFIIGWSQIASAETLSLPRLGCVGIHPTLLPQGRGRAPIPWAIIKGLDATGVTMFKLDEGVDTGPIIEQVEIPLSDSVDAGQLYEKVGTAHRELLRLAWPSLVDGTVRLREQDHSKATIWPQRRPSDGEILMSMTAAEVDRLVRGVSHPYPGAFVAREDHVLKIFAGSVTKPDQDTGYAPLELSDGNYWPTEAVRLDE